MIPVHSRRCKSFVVIATATILWVLDVPQAELRAQLSTIIDVDSANAEMNAAISKARASLPTFWSSYDAPTASETDYSLKVRFPTPRSGEEHIWMAYVKRTADNRYSGRFDNVPRDLPGKQEGDVVTFDDADISDWMFLRNGKIVGGETIRPLLKMMPKADADALRGLLETP